MDRNFAGAIQYLTRAMAQPPYPDTAYQLGYACLKQGDLKSAEKWLKIAAEANPRDKLIPYQLGFVYRGEGREEEAKKAFAVSAQLHEQETKENQKKFVCRQKLKEGLRDEARVACQQLYDPNDPAKLTELGMAYGQYGDFEAALDPLKRAASLDSRAPGTQYNLAFVYLQLNRFEEARTVIANAVRQWPDEFRLNALYGAVLIRLNRDVEACAVLRHAHDLDPQDPQVMDLFYKTTLRLARKSLSVREYADSLRYFQEAAKLRSKDPDPHRGQAEVYDLMGRQAEATAERQHANDLNQAR